jgi:transposase
VYWENDGEWDPNKKRMIDHRISIGKVVDRNAGTMHPNKNYRSLFNSDGTPLQKIDTVETTPDDEQMSEPVSDTEPTAKEPGHFSTYLSYGVYYALYAAAEKIGCIDALKESHPCHWDRIFALAVHCIDAENSVAQDYCYWAFDNYAGLKKNLSSGEISELYGIIADDPAAMQRFIKKFHEQYLKHYPDAKEHAVAFDSTNQNTNSGNIALAEYGHPKVKESLPDINTALIVDQETGVPLYYEHFYGSLLDKTQSPVTIAKLEDLGFKKLFFMMDRGYCAQGVVDALKDQSFAVMCTENLLFVKNLIRTYAATIKDREQYYIPEENIYGVKIPSVEAFGGTYTGYVYYDSERAQDERTTIHLKVKALQEQAGNRRRYSDKLRDKYSKWLVIAKLEHKDPATGRNFSIETNVSAVQECLDEAGFFVVLSNTDKSATQMIQIARMRDHDEKAFRRIKTHFGLTKTYVHNERTYEGKMFVAFVALIVCEAYRWYLRSQLRNCSSMTTATSLGELRKYKIQQSENQKWIPTYAMTKKQKQFLRCLDRTEREVRASIKALTLQV